MDPTWNNHKLDFGQNPKLPDGGCFRNLRVQAIVLWAQTNELSWILSLVMNSLLQFISIPVHISDFEHGHLHMLRLRSLKNCQHINSLSFK